MEKRLLTPDEVAARWGLHPATLANWRCARKGPPFLRIGRKILYREADVIAWEEQKLQAGVP